MAGENPDILRLSKFGFENTADVAVAATLIARGFSITPKPVNPTVMLRNKGHRINTHQVGVRGAMTTAAVEGFADFNGVALLLSSLRAAPTITTPSGATIARDWTQIFTASQNEVGKSITVESGLDGVDTSRFAFGLLNGLKMDFSGSQEIRISGDMTGTLLAEEGVTPTSAGLTELATIPMSPNLLDWYTADTIAGLGAGQLMDAYAGSWELTGRRSPLFPFRSSKPSIAGNAQTENRCFVHLNVEQNSQSNLMMRQARRWSTRYLQFVIGGPEIEPGFNYAYRVIIPYKVNNPDRGPLDNVYGGMYDLEAVNDATLGGFCRIDVRCSLSALPASTDLSAGQQPAALIAALGAVGAGGGGNGSYVAAQQTSGFGGL